MKKAYLDLSIDHLTTDTRVELHISTANERMARGWPALTIAPYGYGYFITVPDVMAPGVSEQMYNLPPDLAFLLTHAASEECELIRFDTDGYVDGDLPWYGEGA